MDELQWISKATIAIRGLVSREVPGENRPAAMGVRQTSVHALKRSSAISKTPSTACTPTKTRPICPLFTLEVEQECRLEYEARLAARSSPVTAGSGGRAWTPGFDLRVGELRIFAVPRARGYIILVPLVS